MADDKDIELKEKTSLTLLVTGSGGYDVMKTKERPWPTAGKGQVVVHVKACGLNFAELMCRLGFYNRRPPLPCVLGFEAAGVITQVGEGVTDRKVGDRVIAVDNFGLWTEGAAISAKKTFLMPKNMSFQEGAAIPVNYITAHMMLFDFGNLRKNKSVLIHMAAGGVGVAATQLCRTVENVTIYGTASAPKHKYLIENGVNHPIDYRTQNFAEEILKISPGGIDIVLDPLSGADGVKGYNILKPMGRIIHFGAANAVIGEQRSLFSAFKMWWSMRNYSPLTMMSQNKMAAGYHLGYLVDYPEIISEVMHELLDLYEQGKIKPKIDSVWTFGEIAQAMAQMHDRKNIGKVILTPRDRGDAEQ